MAVLHFEMNPNVICVLLVLQTYSKVVDKSEL